MSHYLKKELYGLIKEDESIFDFIQDSSLDGLWYWDLENPENEWMNARFWTVLGYDPDEMPHKSNAWQNIINQDDLIIALENFKKHSENPNHPYDQIVRYTHKNGSTVWIHCRGLAIRDKNGRPIRMLGAHQDVSTLKNREQELLNANERVHESERNLQLKNEEYETINEELRQTNEELLEAKEKAEESEEKYRALYNNAPLSYQSLDESGCFIDINPMWSATLGYERSEVIGKWYGDFLHPDYVEHFRINFPAFKKRGYVSNVQFKLRRKDNTYIYVSFEGCVGYTPEGEFKQTYCVFKDITEQKQAEEALRKSEEMLINSQSVAHICAYSTDLNINELGKSIWKCSPEFYKIFGIDETYPHTIEGWAGFIHPDYREELVAYHQYVVNEGIPFNAEYKIIRINDGVERWVQGTGELVYDEKGTPVRMHGAIQDITERKEVEKMLQEKNKEYERINEELNRANLGLIAANEKAEESDRLKSAFLANMSHEIRTPMNGILGFANLLKKNDLKSENQQKYLEIIEESGKRMLNIINDIIDISKIEAGLMKLDMKETNINEQIEYVCTFLNPEAEAKKLKLSFKTPLPTSEVTIKTDSEKVYSILTNLLKNAIKYTEEGAIEMGYHLKTDSEPGELEFYVKDTGIGIPKDRQEAIFDRFIQADIADTKVFEGSGLGLAITKSHVEMLGGNIWVESQEGEGSTFNFTLPYNTEPAIETINGQHTPSEKNKIFRKLKILIAEDDEVSEMLLDETVKMYSKEILKARTGAETVEVCRANPDINLILMDIQMPDMGGHEATQRIREFNKEVVIIAQTAYGLTGDREKSIESGCNDYIAKPMNENELQAMIQKYFGKIKT